MANQNNNDNIKSQIEKLINSENLGDSKTAERILSTNFIAITRSTGIEENRDKLIKAIEKAKSDLENKCKSDKGYYKIRKLNKEHFKVIDDGKIVVSRSLITVKEKGQEDKIFRNIHVFEKIDQEWLCKMWQVTKLEKNKDKQYELVNH